MDFKKRTTLGRTGLSVSRLGLAGGYGIEAQAVEKAFHDYNINYFYWSTPRRSGMGEGLRNLVKKNREKMIIVLQSYDHLGLTVKRSVHKGLRSLGIDYADVVLLGWNNWHPNRMMIRDVLELKEKGLVHFVAMSGHNRKLFGRIAQESSSPIDIFMIRYNAAHPGAEQDIFPHLSGKSRPGITTYTATSWGKLLNPKKMPAGEKPLTASECYRFVLSNPHVDLCMMGPASGKQLKEGITALERGPLSNKEMERIRKIGNYVHG